MNTHSFLPKLQATLDRERVLKLLKGAVACNSITGDEGNFVSFLEKEMPACGLAVVQTAEFLPGRPNIWGSSKTAAKGRHLLFTGHTDTVHVEGWREKWAGTSRENPFGGAIVDGEIWGRGAGDLKAGICASLSAFALLKTAGIELEGMISYAFVGDEESGQPGTGVSAGMRHFIELLKSGLITSPDFAIYVEPTRLDVFTAQMGFFIAEIKITGRTAYFGVPEEGRDALQAAHAVLTSLWRHRDDVAARASHPLVGRAHLLVTELRSGGYIAVPGECRIALIRKLLPGESLDEAVAEMERVIHATPMEPEISVEIAYPASRNHRFGGTPASIDETLASVSMLRSAVAATRPGAGNIGGAPYWSEAPFLINDIKCPTVYCAPGDITNCHTLDERVEIEEYFAAIIAFALFAAEFCGVAKMR